MTGSPGHVLVTGAGGFVGGHVVRRFAAEGWRVTGLVHRRQPKAPVPGATYVAGDISDAASLRELVTALAPDVIVHAAALASDVGPDRLFRRLNYESVVTLAPLATRKFVFISTADVYGIRDFAGEDVSTLSFDDNLRNPYPRYKIKSELWLKANLPPERFACIRPAAIWGPGDETLERRVADFLRSSPFIVHFGKWRGRNRWPLADVRRVAEAAWLAATTSRWDGDGVTVIDSRRVTAEEFYRETAARLFPNRRFRTICLPMWLGVLVGRLSSGLANLLGRTHVLFDPSYYALRTVSSNLDFADASFPDTTNVATEDCQTGRGCAILAATSTSKE